MERTGPKPYYQSPDGRITLYHGDCRELLPTCGDASVDLVLADPPYGVGMKYGNAYSDDRPGYEALVAASFAEMRRVSRLVLLTPGIANIWLYPRATWVLCWAKPGSPRRSGLGGFNEWEPILMYGKRRIYNDFKRLPAWNNTSKSSGGHPCPKPLALYEWLVDKASDVGALLLDPFVGSGTSLIAAAQAGRRAIGIEIEERYCEIAARRLDALFAGDLRAAA